MVSKYKSILECLFFSLVAVGLLNFVYASNNVINHDAVVTVISEEDLYNSIIIEPDPIDFGYVTSGGVASAPITIRNVGEFAVLVDLINNLETSLDPSIGTVKAHFCNWIYPNQTYTTRLELHLKDTAPEGNIQFKVFIRIDRFKAASQEEISPAEAVNAEGKDQPSGNAISQISGVCGKDYRLVSPKRADKWQVKITVASTEDQPIHITIIEVKGPYPYTQGQTITKSGEKTCTLTADLDPSKTYEVWIRDAYAKPFTGTIEEEWS